MKQTNKLASLSLEELQKKRNTVKGVLIGILIAYSILIIAMIIVAIKTKSPIILTMIGGLIALIPILTIQYQQIEKEIKNRENTSTE